MDSPVRILHAVVNMNRGGAETLIMNLYRNIDRYRVQFDFLTCKEGAFDEEIIGLGGRIHRIPYISEVGHSGYLRALHQFFRTHADCYSIIHSHMDRMSGHVLRAAQRAGISVRIAHSHSTASEGKFFNKVYKWYAGNNLQSSATHFMSCSMDAARWLFPKKIKNTIILPNGIESEKFKFLDTIRTSVRDELGIKENEFVVGHVGRFVPVKNHKFILEIFQKLVNERPESVLVLTGDGPLRSEIERIISNYGLTQKVKMLGVRNDVHRLMQAFDVLVFPSLYEGLPVTLVEAQGAGLPCLVSEHISREVDLKLDLMQFLPINKVGNFVRILTEMKKNEQRKISNHRLYHSGFDIQYSAKFIEEFYLSYSEVNYETTNDIYTYV